VVLADAAAVARKDLTLELRSRVATNQILPLAVLVLALFAFALDANTRLLDAAAPGLYWVAVLFAGLLVVQRAFSIESVDGIHDALRLSGLDPPALFLGKQAAVAAQLLLLEAALLAGVILFFDVEVADLPLLVSAALSGTVAFAAAGVIYGALSLGVRVRETLLPLLAVPALAPVLLAGTRAFEPAMAVSAANGWNWVALLVVVAGVYTVVGLVSFGPLLEDG
jgi:heme exporter protein B